MGTVSIKEVARLARVSPGMVSNALNRPERVAPTTRERVRRAIHELGFVRHGSASTLRAGHSRTIGLSVMDIGNPFFTDIAAGAEDVASDLGYAVILGNSAGSRSKEEHNLLVFAEQRVRGVLITPSDEDPGLLDGLRERGISVVLVDHPAHRPDLCSVTVDDVAGGRLAVAHLLDLGVLRGLLQAGVGVPGDVALIGYDDIDFAAASAVSLSSVRQPTYRLGQIAAELLLEECGDPGAHAHRQIVFQPELVVRESTGGPGRPAATIRRRAMTSSPGLKPEVSTLKEIR
ncbi:LacI family DNA-binding transcriptional regulator [Streptosporangium roseum]|uniref:LacI family DNA-binding transcriptional regulator n=1 Tax=Streptosporangium roseum TaxID=2001 RepID=UPI00333278FD